MTILWSMGPDPGVIVVRSNLGHLLGNDLGSTVREPWKLLLALVGEVSDHLYPE